MRENASAPLLTLHARLGWELECRPIYGKDSDQPIDQDLYFRPALNCGLAIEDEYRQVVLDLKELLESAGKPGVYFLLNCECGLADDAGIMGQIIVHHPNEHSIVWEFDVKALRSLLLKDTELIQQDGYVRLEFDRVQYEADLRRMVGEAKQANTILELCEVAPNDYSFTEYLLKLS